MKAPRGYYSNNPLRRFVCWMGLHVLRPITSEWIGTHVVSTLYRCRYCTYQHVQNGGVEER